MQFVEGTDIARQIRRHGPLTIPEAFSVLLQVASGLDYVHSKGVVHRDVKPSNLMIESSGVVKILDLGLAQFEPHHPSGSDETLVSAEAMGTIDYMAPEQAQEGGPVDARCDVYSLGCTLFFMLTGRRMYEGDTVLARLQNHSRAAIPDLRQLRPDVPACVQDLFCWMVAKRREDRLPSMARLSDEVERCVMELELEIGISPPGSLQSRRFLSTQGCAISDSLTLMTELVPRQAIQIQGGRTLKGSSSGGGLRAMAAEHRFAGSCGSC